MKMAHHSLIVKAASELVGFWSQDQTNAHSAPSGFDLEKAQKILGNPHRVKQMSKWTARADKIGDVVVEEGLSRLVVKRISNATSFQHFAYCGSMGTLKDGKSKVKQYDGYCWDCDPFMKWYEELANISWADVSYKPDCGIFEASFMRQSPGAKQISGSSDWDDQLYPSALDLAEFYFNGAKRWKTEKRGWALQSLCYAIHMLQDLTVPHHVLCTIERGHAGYESDMRDMWRRIYADRTDEQKMYRLADSIGPRVSVIFEEIGETGVREVGKKLVDLTRGRLPADDRIPSRTKHEALVMSCHAIAATLRAVELS